MAVILTEGGGGTAGPIGPAGTITPPPNVTVGAPVVRVQNGIATVTFPITYPGTLGSLEKLFVRLESPYSGTDPADTATNIPPPTTVTDYGPFKLTAEIVIEHPSPDNLEVWAAWVTSASSVVQNKYTDVGTPFVTFSVPSDTGLIAGAEWAPNPPNPIGIVIEREILEGAEQWWRPTLTWTLPTDDARWPNVAQWDIGLFDPSSAGPRVSSVDEDLITSLGTIGPTIVTFTSAWLRVKPNRVTNRGGVQTVNHPVTKYLLMVRPVTVEGNRNTYVPGVTAAIEAIIGPDPHTLNQAASLVVASSYTDPDNDGKEDLLFDISFVAPQGSPTWSYVDFWYQRPDDLLWYNLLHPDRSPASLAISQIPSDIGTWNFLLIDKDANGFDRDGNSSSDPFHPPAGSATFSLVINPPNVGSAGVEYADLVTSPSVTIGGQVTQPDGTYKQLVTIAAVLPDDTRFGGYLVRIKYTSGALNGKIEELVDIPYPRLGADVIWKPPAGSISSEWYFVSYNKRGQLNTIQTGVTPKVDETVGGTSQLDFTAAKLASLNQSFLRINEATNLFEIYDVLQAIVGALQVGGGTNNGTCDTVNSGANTNVTRASGNNFVIGMIGTTIVINGSPVLVLTYTDANHISVKTNLGSHTGVTWSHGRSPQLKVYDRTNTLIGFIGDDSDNTGYVGTFLGKLVRLGGTISSPVLEVDSGGAVSIAEAVFLFTFTGGATLTIEDTLLPAFSQPGIIIADTIGRSSLMTPYTFGLLGTTAAGRRPLAYLTQLNGMGQFLLDSDLGGANSGLTLDGDAGGFTVYKGKATVGMGVPPIYASASASAQSANISATNLQAGGGIAPAGRYRVSGSIDCTTAGGGTASVIVSWVTPGGVTKTVTVATVLLTSTAVNPGVFDYTLRANGSNNITWSVTYAGTGGAKYDIDVVLERLT